MNADKRDVLSALDADVELITKTQQLAGHFPDADAIDRARCVLEGRITSLEAYADLDDKYSNG